MMTMRFGKYKGRTIDQIPKGYLRWLVANANLSGELAEEVVRMVGDDDGKVSHRPNPNLEPEPEPDEYEEFRQWDKELLRRSKR